jgi:hypothetical protein
LQYKLLFTNIIKYINDTLTTTCITRLIHTSHTKLFSKTGHLIGWAECRNPRRHTEMTGRWNSVFKNIVFCLHLQDRSVSVTLLPWK